MNLELLESELKKRWKYPYRWGRKQSNDWDHKTNFIYKTNSIDKLLLKIQDFNQELKDYALNRWYNFWSAKGVEYIFSMHKNVTPNVDQYDKLVDFKINNIPFDHKTSVFPKGFNKSIYYAMKNKRELIKWLYDNQSQQGRKHLKNRLFIVLYNKGGAHWKLKAELLLIKGKIDSYMDDFSKNNLVEFDFNGTTLSDIIWGIK